MERLRQRGKNQTKTMRTYLLCIKKIGVQLMDNKITRDNKKKLRSSVLPLWDIWEKLQCCLKFRVLFDEKQKAI